MWTPIKNNADLAGLVNNSMIRRLPDEDDHINQPVEWVVIENHPKEETMVLSMPTLLNDWLKKWYGVKILVETLSKNYESFKNGIWEYKR